MSHADKPVVIRLPDGAEYGVASPEVAARVYPTAEVVRYQDGMPLDAGAPAGDVPVNLAGLKRDELEAHAARIGLAGPYSAYATKADLITAIEATS